jgi:hypothetical protein
VNEFVENNSHHGHSNGQLSSSILVTIMSKQKGAEAPCLGPQMKSRVPAELFTHLWHQEIGW